MTYIRFVVEGLDEMSGEPMGLFRPAYDLTGDADVDLDDRRRLRGLLDWFKANLNVPDRFNRSRSKEAWRRDTRGIAWFKDTAREHIAKVREMGVILRCHGFEPRMLKETRIGYIVYEDEHQAIAEPFADTDTGR